MDLQQLLDIAKLVGIVGGMGTFLYFYFTKPKVKEVTDKLMKFLPPPDEARRQYPAHAGVMERPLQPFLLLA